MKDEEVKANGGEKKEALGPGEHNSGPGWDTGRVGGGQGIPRPRQNMQVIKEEMA